MKHLFITTALLFSMTLFSQVGINNISPKATLDITPKTTDGSKPEGILIPQLDGNSLKTSAYDTPQKGIIVYAKSPASPTDPKTVNITAEGYYYFDGSVWQKMTGAATDDTTNDAWINDTTNGLVKLGTKANGTARSAGTDFVVKDNGQIGIGTSSPDGSAALDIEANNKGLLIPRVSLTSTIDQTTVATPANGLIVYNTATTTGTNAVEANYMYIWNGSFWGKLATSSNSIFIPITNLVRRSNINQVTHEFSGIVNLDTQVSQITDGNWNSATNTYTIPSNGTYQIALTETVNYGLNTTFYHAAGYKSGGSFYQVINISGNWNGGAGMGNSYSGTSTIYLTAGSTIRPVYQNCDCNYGQTYTLQNVNFSVIKVSN